LNFSLSGTLQKLESALNEEAMLLASFIRGKRIWEPRLAPLLTIVIPKIYMTKSSDSMTFQSLFPKL
jgi:hypothetical protein